VGGKDCALNTAGELGICSVLWGGGGGYEDEDAF
jgi:hypothetical protein